MDGSMMENDIRVLFLYFFETDLYNYACVHNLALLRQRKHNMQIQCPYCQEWIDSEDETCAFCKKPINESQSSPLVKMDDENSVVDLSLLYARGESKKAEAIIKKQPDREVYLRGKLTTGRAILRDRKVGIILIAVSSIALIVMALVLL